MMTEAKNSPLSRRRSNAYLLLRRQNGVGADILKTKPFVLCLAVRVSQASQRTLKNGLLLNIQKDIVSSSFLTTRLHLLPHTIERPPIHRQSQRHVPLHSSRSPSRS